MNITSKDLARQAVLSLFGAIAVALIVRNVPQLKNWIHAQWQ
jgi:hypothetical protein